MSGVVYLCPDCGSPAVDVPLVEGGFAACRVCDWKAKDSALLALPVEGSVLDAESLREALHRDYLGIFKDRGLLMRMAALLERYGFLERVDDKLDGEALSRYVMAAASAMLRAFVLQRVSEEKRRLRGPEH